VTHMTFLLAAVMDQFEKLIINSISV